MLAKDALVTGDKYTKVLVYCGRRGFSKQCSVQFVLVSRYGMVCCTTHTVCLDLILVNCIYKYININYYLYVIQ